MSETQPSALPSVSVRKAFDDVWIEVRYGAQTDVGRRRGHNEDCYGMRFPLFVVADGMGGHTGGVPSTILLPQVLRNVLPSLTGIFIGLLKDTSLAFIVNVPELTTVAGQVNSRVQIYPAAIFIFTGLVYYLLCFSLEKITQRRFALK